MRDKYIRLSKQRLGDNPRDYDGVFNGVDEDLATPSGVRPDADVDPFQNHNHTTTTTNTTAMNKPWKIYPRPPPPHWHWKDKTSLSSSGNVHDHDALHSIQQSPEEEFDFSSCEIPASDSLEFAMDRAGVYQVYKNLQGKRNKLVELDSFVHMVLTLSFWGKR